MTAAGVRKPPPEFAAASPAGQSAIAALRLTSLYLESRRILAAIGLLAGPAALLWAALYWHWSIAGGAAARDLVPLVAETGAAAIVAVTSHGPFGDSERATGRWLPYLRLAGALLPTAAAFGALAAGSLGGRLPGGTITLLRNLAGMTGTGLLVAVVLSGAFAWVGPMAYLLVTEGALAGAWTTPWIWPARPPDDAGGALCAYGVFAVGLAAVTLLGSRVSSRPSALE
jgi:hypothetical protein